MEGLFLELFVNIVNLIYAFCCCMFVEGDNKLSGTIPSEIGTIKSLSNFSLGKKVIHLYVCECGYVFRLVFQSCFLMLPCIHMLIDQWNKAAIN